MNNEKAASKKGSGFFLLFQNDSGVLKRHAVARPQLGTLPGFCLTVELNEAFLNNGFGLTTALGQVYGLEQLYQLNEFATNGKV